MKRLLNYKNLIAFLAIFVIIGSADTFAQKKKPVLHRRPVVRKTLKPAEKLYSVATGTTLRVRMNKTISSKTTTVGSTFTATVAEPVYSTTGVVVIPSGSTVVGRVDSVKRAANGGKPGQIDASFIEVRLPNGRRRAINGSLTDLISDSSKSDNEGTASGDTMKRRKIIFIGGGGAGGAILGAAIGGGKGALIGGIIGAGAGFLGDRYTKGEEAEVKSGTEFGVYLNQAISLPKFAEVNP